MNIFTRSLLVVAVLAGGLVVSDVYAMTRSWTPSPATQPNIQLFQAVTHGDPTGAKDALVRGADINMIDNDGYTLWHRVAVTGNGAMINFLFENGADLSSLSNSNNLYGQIPSQMAQGEAVNAIADLSVAASVPGF
ncbi:MAG: hypothetical protein WCW33_05995 [Candidatus Babeliales bacterium]|jgi:ankyrin repeat protein